LRTIPLSRELLLPLSTSSEPERIKAQLSLLLMGNVSIGLATLYPSAMALLISFFGLMASILSVSRPCQKCGDAISKRADPEVSAGSPMCTQCVNVFTRKHLVVPALKVRKQMEIARFQSRRERVARLLSFVVSGAGHLFSGRTLVGLAFTFCFTLFISAFAVRHGVLRGPYESLPIAVKLVPLGIGLLILYAVSIRSLRKARN
jgi:hypothetical protein